MLVIGLTGGIGTGKSETARLLGSLGAVIVDADVLSHEVYAPGTAVLEQILLEFGEDLLLNDGSLDRRKLAGIVFENLPALDRLQRIVHPPTKDAVRLRLQHISETDAQVAVVVAPMMVEAGWVDMVHEVWVVTASERNVIERVCRRDGLTESKVRSRIAAQLSQEDRLAYADIVIDNEHGFNELRDRVCTAWRDSIFRKTN